MRAAQINSYGDKDVLKVVNEAAKPTPGQGEVLVAVNAAGVNPFDWKVRKGFMKDSSPLEFPATLGGDFAGIVAELGQGVSGLSEGDEVYGQANAVGGHGSYAEFTPVKATSLSIKPKSVDFVTAAALPLAGVSSYQALVEHADLKRDQKVLIHGGAGGIGSFAIQLAKHLGAFVATTASAEDADFVRSLGADEVIDYKSQNFWEVTRDYDVVYDTIGGETFQKSHQVLKPGGVIVSMVASPDEALMKQYGVKDVSQFTRVTTEKLDKLRGLVDDGLIKIQVAKVFPLEEAADALAYIESGKQRGKVVIRVV
jgi:NADPH:quinone reductase-like Zn-dependent oxidoreductase